MAVLFDGGADVNKAANGGGTPACIGAYAKGHESVPVLLATEPHRAVSAQKL